MAEQTKQPERPSEGSAVAQHRARGRSSDVVESAGEHDILPDALGNEPTPANQSQVHPMARPEDVKVIDGHEALATSPDAETGIHGMALPGVGEVAGGNIQGTLAPPEANPLAQRPMAKEQAAMRTRIGREIAGLIARPVTEWGILGPGDRVKGQMLLLDLNTGKKVRGMDGHIVNAGQLYMNLRNVPEALATGDTIEQILG